jgi:hypothetical protein
MLLHIPFISGCNSDFLFFLSFSLPFFCCLRKNSNYYCLSSSHPGYKEQQAFSKGEDL